jgi:hypothetical protein
MKCKTWQPGMELAGTQIGKWTILNRIEKGPTPGHYYECICECGNVMIKAATELRAGRSTQCRQCKIDEMHNPEKEIGKQYGKWHVIRYLGIHRKLHQFLCRCVCGFEGKHCAADLRAGKSKSCLTCANKEIAKRNIKHGMNNTRIYKVWSAMLHRCNNSNATSYIRYGGRGIKVCERWNKFENFLEDMGIPKDGLTLDRINNDGDYEPSNCRWVTHKENCQNR